MLGKSQIRVICIVLSVVLLVAAFMTGIMSQANNTADVKALQEEYEDFAELISSTEQFDKDLAEGKDTYESRKAGYDAELKKYNTDLDEYNAAEKKFAEDIMGFNTRLVEYSAGKNAMSSGQSAIDEGRKQLKEGWDAYNAGKDAFEQGKQEAAGQLEMYEQGKAAYEEGLKAYEQLMSSIKRMESMGVPHRLALTIISGTARQHITDETIADMKAQLDEAKAQIDAAEALLPDAKQQMAAAEKQLEDTRTMLEKGEKELDSAEEQLKSGQQQIASIGSSIDSDQASLDETSAKLAATKAELDKRGEELDAEKKELAVYEDLKEKLDRRHDTLVDGGYGVKDDSIETLLASARVHEEELRSEYSKVNASFNVTYKAHMFAVLLCAVALAILKNHRTAAFRIALVGAVLGAASLIASMIFGALDITGVLASAFTLAGISLTEREKTA